MYFFKKVLLIKSFENDVTRIKDEDGAF